MGCTNCTQELINKQSKDEQIIQLAKVKAKETGKPVGLYLNEYGQLCIATGGEIIIRIITPYL